MNEENDRKPNTGKEEPHIDPPTEEDFTKAMETLSDTDRDIFEDTGVIHVDRNMPAETQAMHVVKLQKKHENKRRRVLLVVLILMIAGLLLSGGGILLNRRLSERRTKKIEAAASASARAEETPDTVSISIDEASFPDPIFRQYILDSFDTNHDGKLSGTESAAVTVILVPEDSSVTDIHGIENFRELKSLTAKNNQIQAVDLSENRKLEYLDFSGSQIASLDLSKNRKLTQVNLTGDPLTSLILPEKSEITELDTDSSSISCEKDDKGIYNSCKAVAPQS